MSNHAILLALVPGLVIGVGCAVAGPPRAAGPQEDQSAKEKLAKKQPPAQREAKPKPVIEPELKRCVLRDGRRGCKPVGVRSPAREQHLAGGLRVILDKNRVTAENAGSGEKVWIAQAPAGVARPF